MNAHDDVFLAEAVRVDGSTKVLMTEPKFDDLVGRLERNAKSGRLKPMDWEVRIHRLPARWISIEDGFHLADLTLTESKDTAYLRFVPGRSKEDAK